jgi:integrase-like protein
MTTTTPSMALATTQPVFSDSERLALAGFLAGYRGLTREAYTLDMRQFTAWCRTRSLVAAGLGPPAGHALISQLALNGLRVSEATGADIEHLGLERGHRTLVITRKGGRVVTIPLAPRTARAIGLAVGDRDGGPVFLAAGGRRLDRHGAARIVGRVTRRAGIAKNVTPYTLRHVFITAAPRRRGTAARRTGSRLPRRPAHHDAIRPGTHQPEPACDLHRRRVHRRSSPVAPATTSGISLAAFGGQTAAGLGGPPKWLPTAAAGTSANRCYARLLDQARAVPGPSRQG